MKKQMITQSEKMNIESIERRVNRGSIILNPAFQRNYVYSVEKASNVIQSILMDMPLGVVYLADFENKNLCVDGQQRLKSILKFINNEFRLKKLEVLPELNGLLFSELNNEDKNKIYDYALEITKIKECDMEQIYFLYEKLNLGSVKLNNQEIRRCVYQGAFNDMIEEIAENETILYFLGSINNNRLARVEAILNALAILENYNYKVSRKQLLNEYMEKHKNDDKRSIENTRIKIIKTFRLIKDVLGDRAFKFKGKEKITLVLFYPIFYSFSIINDKDIRFNADAIRKNIIGLKQEDVCVYNPNGNVNGDPKGVRHTIDKVNNLVLKSIGKNKDNRKRTFAIEIRRELFEHQSGICGICNQKILDIDESEIDHVVPYSLGGETNINNAQLVHSVCNKYKSNFYK